MTLHAQLLWGSFYLGLCCLLHVGLLGLTVSVLRRLDHSKERGRERPPGLGRIIALLFGSFMAIVFSHTVQVWLWAWALLGIGPLEGWNDAIYFSLVTYTSLGYGDVVLGPGARVFGALGSVTGLLAFGLSTAFLVALMSRVLSSWFGEGGRGGSRRDP